MECPVLETPRFRLVPASLEQAGALLEILGDEAVARYLQSPALASLEASRERLRAWDEQRAGGRGLHWAILVREGDAIAGFFALHYLSAAHRRGELGSYLRREWWGRGLSTEVTREVLRFAFLDLDLHRVELRCDPRNTASMAIAPSLGFRLEGILRDYVCVEGRGFVDEAVHALLREEYRVRGEEKR